MSCAYKMDIRKPKQGDRMPLKTIPIRLLTESVKEIQTIAKNENMSVSHLIAKVICEEYNLKFDIVRKRGRKPFTK